MTVIRAKYPPSTTPVAKISLSFQLSGNGDGFTRSFEMVMIVPIDRLKLDFNPQSSNPCQAVRYKLERFKPRNFTIV